MHYSFLVSQTGACEPVTTSGIGCSLFKSSSVTGYRLHVRCCHEDDWNRHRYKRSGIGVECTENVAGNVCLKMIGKGFYRK